MILVTWPAKLWRRRAGWDAYWIGQPSHSGKNAAAADLTAQSAKVLRQRILEAKLETIYSEVELPLVLWLYQMERAGFKVDPKSWQIFKLSRAKNFTSDN